MSKRKEEEILYPDGGLISEGQSQIALDLLKQFGATKERRKNPTVRNSSLEAYPKALSKAWVLQNAASRGLTVNEFLKLVLQADVLLNEDHIY